MLTCAVSVDLDEIPNYASIHGISLTSEAANAVYEVAVGRLVEWSARREFPLTLFTVGSDLRRAENALRLRRASEHGHEIANHSLDHFYDLTRRSPSVMREQVEIAADLIERAVGVRPVGFRAPGYTTTDALYEVLRGAGVSYSSSVFPCPSYYLLKSLAIVWKRWRGRPSHSIIDTPRVLTAPPRPYRIGQPYTRPGTGLLELPIQTTPWLRLPWIGTSITLGKPWLARWLTRQLVGEPFLNLELHGIDVLDRHDGLEGLVPYQPDVRVTLENKLRALDAVIDTLKSAGYRFVTLRDAAVALNSSSLRANSVPEAAETRAPLR
jgi:peptidoglycan-N-acetylglucosamine deacetylase